MTQTKSLKARKALNTRHMNQCKEEYNEVKYYYEKGWSLYLGEPIVLRLKMLEEEIVTLKVERRKLDAETKKDA